MAVLQPKPADNSAVEERLVVTLKTLIDLSGPAAHLNLRSITARARQSGSYLSSFKGRGMEFDETRAYQTGDDIRSIDWRVTARTGTTHTKVFREERERPVFISVDDRAAMHFATRGVFKSVLAAKLSALLAWRAEIHGDRIGGQVFSEHRCFEIKPKNGKHGVLTFFQALLKPQESFHEAVTLDYALARLTKHVRPGSLVFIVSDFRGLNASSEAYLNKLHRHCDVFLIFIYDLLESHLPTKGYYRFTDGERDIVIDAHDRQRLAAYHNHFSERKQRITALADKLGLRLIVAATTDDPLQLLTAP
jgi:uncharacterized protein (DUF58 family)